MVSQVLYKFYQTYKNNQAAAHCNQSVYLTTGPRLVPTQNLLVSAETADQDTFSPTKVCAGCSVEQLLLRVSSWLLDLQKPASLPRWCLGTGGTC